MDHGNDTLERIKRIKALADYVLDGYEYRAPEYINEVLRVIHLNSDINLRDKDTEPWINV